MLRDNKKLVTLAAKYGPLVDCLADLLGPRAEIVLHDTSRPDKSIIAIRNGHITGRSIGAPLTDLGFYMLRESDHRIETLGVYLSTTDAGKKLKCNAVNLRDHHDRIEAILCINIDVTSQSDFIAETAASTLTEHYQNSIDEVIRTMMASIPDGVATRDRKVEIVRALEARGVFLARGSVRRVAAALNIAIPTVYKYIHQTHSSNTRQTPTSALRYPNKSTNKREGTRPPAGRRVALIEQ